MEREVLNGKLFWRREPLNFTAWCRQQRFDFSGSSPYKNFHHGCGHFSFVTFLSVAWPYNFYTHDFSCGDILIHDWPCHTTAGHWSTQQAFQTLFDWLSGWDHTRMDFVLLCTWQNALCTYSCVLNRMQWVLLCTQLASLMYFDVRRINIWKHQCTCTQNVTSYKQR